MAERIPCPLDDVTVGGFGGDDLSDCCRLWHTSESKGFVDSDPKSLGRDWELSTLKAPALKEVLKPLEGTEEAAWEKYDGEAAQYRRKKDIYDARKDALHKSVLNTLHKVKPLVIPPKLRT